jgi:hypothetical protein
MRVIRSDDMLFLAGGSNDVMRLYDAAGFASAVSVSDWANRIAAREALFARLGIPWCQLLVPEKLSVLGDEIVAARCVDPVSPATRLAAALQTPKLINPTAYFRSQTALGYALYPRTDSHWTCLGALSALQWAASAMGVEIDFATFHAVADRPLVYHGDLWTSDYADIAPDRFDRREVPSSIVRIHANTIVRLKERERRQNEVGLHVGSAVAYRNSAAQIDERLLLFGSSFSDHRIECSLLTFVAALFFREIHFVWSANLDLPLIERLQPDRVLIEMPERFLTACPPDDFDLGRYEADTSAGFCR